MMIKEPMPALSHASVKAPVAALQTPAAPLKTTAVPSQKGWALWLTLLTVIGLVLRAVATSKDSFWYDEAVTAQLSHASVWDLFRGHAKDAGNPPLYWIVEHFWSFLFGNSEAAFRSTSVLFGTLAIPALAALGRRLIGSTPALIAAALWAISPLALELSDEARAYALMHLLAIVCTLFFVRWFQEKRKLDLFLYAVSTALLCYDHYFGFAVPLVHGMAVLMSRDRKRLILPWIGAMIVAALLWLPWLPTFLQQIGTKGNLSRMGDRWYLQFMVTPIAFSLGRTFAWRDSSQKMLLLGMSISLVGFWIPAAWGSISLGKRPRRNGKAPALTQRNPFAATLLPLWLLFPIFGPLVVAIIKSPIYHHRYASVGMPAFLLLAAFGLSRMSKYLSFVCAAVICGATGVAIANYYHDPLKDDWRSASTALLAKTRPDDVVLFDSMDEITSFKYYVADAQMPHDVVGVSAEPIDGRVQGARFEAGKRLDEKTRDITDSVFNAHEVWLVLCVPNGDAKDYKNLFRSNGLNLVEMLHFQRIDLLRFERGPSWPRQVLN